MIRQQIERGRENREEKPERGGEEGRELFWGGSNSGLEQPDETYHYQELQEEDRGKKKELPRRGSDEEQELPRRGSDKRQDLPRRGSS
jgi:hypothetical protein